MVFHWLLGIDTGKPGNSFASKRSNQLQLTAQYVNSSFGLKPSPLHLVVLTSISNYKQTHNPLDYPWQKMWRSGNRTQPVRLWLSDLLSVAGMEDCIAAAVAGAHKIVPLWETNRNRSWLSQVTGLQTVPTLDDSRYNGLCGSCRMGTPTAL